MKYLLIPLIGLLLIGAGCGEKNAEKSLNEKVKETFSCNKEDQKFEDAKIIGNYAEWFECEGTPKVCKKYTMAFPEHQIYYVEGLEKPYILKKADAFCDYFPYIYKPLK